MMKIILPLMMTLLYISLNSFTNQTWLFISSLLLIMSLFSLILNYNPMISLMNISSWLSLDNLSMPLVTLTLWISSLMIYASMNILLINQSPKHFLMYIMTLCIILTITFSVNNILLFYISFESSLIPTLLLIIGWGYQPERMQAGMYMILYTITASLPLLLSIIYIYNQSSHTFMFMNFHMKSFNSSLLMNMWWLMTIMAFMVKMPLYSTHLWLPKAHVEAPVAGSMILAGLLLKLGSYGLLRMAFIFPKSNMSMSPYISNVALWGGAITSFICIRQTDLKSLIAYSSVGHMGLLTAGVMSNSLWGYQGALALMLAHGLCSSGLFALANMTYEATNTRSVYLTKGLLSLFPVMTLWWFLLAAGNMAAPPTLNLLSEIMLISSSLFLSVWTIMGLALMSFLAAVYSLYLYSSSQHGQTPSFMNPMNLLTPRNNMVILLHTVPLFLLITKSDIILSWI